MERGKSPVRGGVRRSVRGPLINRLRAQNF
jgi:hypothetical protein